MRHRPAEREPPDTDLLRWGQVMGVREVMAHEQVAAALREATQAGGLMPGTSGSKATAEGLTNSVLLGPAPGEPNRTLLSSIIEERVAIWVDLAHPQALREMRAALAEGLLVEPQPPAHDELESALRPLTWLLESCRAGVTLTQTGYLPPFLVREGTDLFGWWLSLPGRPRSEVDVHQLVTLREAAARLRLLTRRGRRLTTSRSAVRLLADLTALWKRLAPAIGAADRYEATLSELVSHRLLQGPATEEELAGFVVPVVAAQGWSSGGRPLAESELRYAMHGPLGEWRLFGLLDEQRPRWEEGVQEFRWNVAFSRLGRATALAHLHARATGPRMEPFD